MSTNYCSGSGFSAARAPLHRHRLSNADVDDLTPGQGVVVREGANIVARSLDTDGHAHAVSARCTHMGCIVNWNDEAQSWDCGCHGSRFAPSGEVLRRQASVP